MGFESPARRGVVRTLWDRKWRLIVPAVLGAGAAAGVSALMPVRYMSQTTIMLVPAAMGAEYGRPAVTVPLDERLATVRQQVLSRTRLERLVNEFNLYADERRTELIQEIVETFRDDVDVRMLSGGGSETLQVAYTGSQPRTVQRVTERLSSMFMDATVSNRQNMTETAATFLESQIEQTRERLNAFEASMKARSGKPTEATTVEFDVLRDQYRSLLQKRDDVRISAELEARPIGESFRVIEAARLPERPVGPTRTMVNLMGAGAGLAMGVVLVAAAPRRRTPPQASTS